MHLNNSQLGSDDPLNLDQMVSEITRRENVRNGLSKKGSKSMQIADDLKSGKVKTDEP